MYAYTERQKFMNRRRVCESASVCALKKNVEAL